jgi:hypothetical protein
VARKTPCLPTSLASQRLDTHYAKQNQLIFFTTSQAKQRDFPGIVPRTLEWLRQRRNVAELKGSIRAQDGYYWLAC